MPSVFQLPVADDGEPLPHDHPTLGDESKIIRRISENYIVRDDNTGQSRVSSALFKHDGRQGYLSVDSEGCIAGKSADPVEWVTTPHWIGAFIIAVSDLRSIDVAKSPKDRWKIGMAPLRENECHAAIWGKISKGQSNAIQRKCEWLVPLKDVEKLD